MRGSIRQILLVTLSLFAAPFSVRAAEGEKTVDFNRDIRPILSDKCYFCHGPDAERREADLRLDVREAALEAGAIVPSSVGDSTLLDRIAHEDPDEVMPPPKTKLAPLTGAEQALLKRWIEEGAEYQSHWSFVPLTAKPTVPVAGEGWARDEMDRFVAEKREAAGLKPASEASREKWIRRVTFDLTGLPPTLAEIDAFLADLSPRAYEVVVDRLLVSKACGERLAMDWLDLARYADTFGYQADRNMSLWPWRDWVIRAFTDNLPYDQFITWQTAGDLLPNPTRDQMVATAFNRLHRQTNEGGSINEEFRIEYVNDRVITNGAAFLGMTLECSRCHDHKYDPISIRDYYSLSAFFNNIDESGLYSHFTETAPTPALSLYEGDAESKHRAAREKVAALESRLAEATAKAGERFRASGASAEPVVGPPVTQAAFEFEDGKVSGGNRVVERLPGNRAIEFSGDDEMTLGDAALGDFSRTDAFSFSLWVKPAAHKSRMVVFHRSRAAEDSAFRGYEFMLYDGKPTFSLIHFWPGNALRVQSREPLPLNEWTHLTIAYDGSSRAAGVKLFRDGVAETLEVVRDALTLDIGHRKEWGDSDVGNVRLQLAGRFRDVGFGGGAIDAFRIFDRELSPLEVRGNVNAELAKPGLPALTAGDRLAHHLLNDPECARIREELRAARVEENAIAGGVKQIMVMREMPGRRDTHTLFRGQYDQPRDAVTPDTPAAILPFAEEWPRNRLGLAKWLTDPRNPLVARVTVNRYWSIFFGRGLVGTPEDFGSQGEPPSHPELLNWLAKDFMDSGWDVRALLRRIALSATYRQDSVPADPSLWTEDPENRQLARGPRHRLSAEAIRDNALAVSGLLVNRVGGPSVNPYELAASFKPLAPGSGEALYRRSLYTFWKRTAPPPAMVTFDATAREVCTVKRESTATPLQALVLLNGPQYVEAARVMAERLIAEGGDTLRQRIEHGFRLATGRRPDLSETAILEQLHAEQFAHYRGQPAEASALLKVGARPVAAGHDPAEVAALAALCQGLLNYDETYTKR
jgi:hypothetical protein